ncbi:type IV pilin, partial [Citrobacter braakii]
CRNLASQVGAQWDYVASGTAAAGAQLGSADPLDMAEGTSASILKSLAGNTLSPTTISAEGFCDAGESDNALILGSR